MKNSIQLTILNILIVFFIVSCSVFKKAPKTETIELTTSLEEIPQKQQHSVEHYNSSEKRIHDILHTKLSVNFDWENKKMNGEAWLKIKPYFYPSEILQLDAKSMEIISIKLLEDTIEKELDYNYDQQYLIINLPRIYKRNEEFNIYIKYIACPDNVTQKGSSAISMAKGLYFINADNSNPNQPKQIWTQGETDANSVWFPTIDDPVEKTTQEMHITVEDKFKTLSNGELIYSSLNGDGTRTDFWKMDQPHSPYLFMMAIGEFEIVEDIWKKEDGTFMDVHYYVDPKYKEHARAIFGKTPKMLTYFSNLLGVEYPWVKYHQVVVHDFVSGAMENTTATIHGEFLHQTKREIIDGSNESIIAHELFHHWFGDLVTCESWSNLPLNESFANYSQYLWDEEEYGKMEADMNAADEMEGYFLSSQQGGHSNLIRFAYADKEDMFDGHSYNKGGRILHMLRDYLGDEAFFMGLQQYLKKHAYNTAEAHDLRLCFEEICGEDLNWFFNQWFFAKGHPILNIKQNYIHETKELEITITQKQDISEWPIYKLPIHIDIYTGDKIQHEFLWLTKKWDTVRYQLEEEPLLVNIDSHKSLLAKKTETKPLNQWVYQLNHAPLWLDKKEAMNELIIPDSNAINAIIKALDHDFWNIRVMAMKNLEYAVDFDSYKVKNKLIKLAQNDQHPKVRTYALKCLSKYFIRDDNLESTFENAIKDSSYSVVSEGLMAITFINTERGLTIAKQLEKIENVKINQTVASIYAEHGGADEHLFFINTANELHGFNKYSFMQQYLTYLLRQEEKEIKKGIQVFIEVAKNGTPWYLKLSGYQLISAIQNSYIQKQSALKIKIEEMRSLNKENEAVEMEIMLNNYKQREIELKNQLDLLIENETDKEVLKYLLR